MTKLIAILILLWPSVAYSSTITVGTGGVTAHGGYFDPELAKYMPNKVDVNGRLILHPLELSVNYKDYVNHYQQNITIFKDCFDGWANYFASGAVFGRDGYDFGFLLGIYTRERPVFFEKYGNRIVRLEVEAPAKPWWRDDRWEVYPLGFLTSGKSWPIIKEGQDSILRFSVNVASNYYLTHAYLGLSW